MNNPEPTTSAIRAADLTPGMVVFDSAGGHGTVRLVEPIDGTESVVVVYVGGHVENHPAAVWRNLVSAADVRRRAAVDLLVALSHALYGGAPVPDVVSVRFEYAENGDLDGLAVPLDTPVTRTSTGYRVVKLAPVDGVEFNAYGVRGEAGAS